MKKRFVALLLCLVMLVTCMGVGLDVISGDEDAAAPAATVEPTAEPSAEPVSESSAEPSAEPASDSDLYAQLMACKTQAEMNAILEEFGEEQITAQLTEEQLIAINEYYSSLTEGSSETEQEQDSSSYTPAVNFTNVAPLLDPVKGAASRKAARAAANSDSNTDKGMKFDKTATDNGDGTYTIQLEAYATGSKVISEITKDVPTDIVLVLDQSGSMADCIGCGESIDKKNQTHVVYKPVYNVTQNTSGGYYILYDGKYQEVMYCAGGKSEHSSQTHKPSWVLKSWMTWGYVNSHKSNLNDSAIMPKTSAEDSAAGHVQFYVKTNETCTSRLDSLKTAVTSFTNAVAAKAAGKDGDINTTADNINHRIAIVGFASESGYNDNTELLSISGTNSGSVGVKYGSISTKNLKDVLQNMDTASGKAMVSNAINALAAYGATRTDLGMDMAERILNANPVAAGEQRNRVVIVFTDGSPTNQNGFQKNVANDAITTASDIKNSGTTVYSIGVFSGADASSAGTEPSGNLGQNSSQLTSASNWFMQKLSSNNGKVQSPSYYLSAGDSASLNNIFKQISDQIESGDASTTLDSKTVIKDVVSEAFKLPEGATANNITLETYKYGGSGNWTKNSDAMGAKATVDAATGEVSVTGFDFKENYVADIKDGNGNVTGYRGNKLVIKFKVTAKAGFLGGNGVYTNDNAGIYGDKDAKNPTFTFDKPTVDVKIKDVAVTALDKNVYLKSGLTAEQLKSDSTVKVGNVVLNLNADNYGLEAWQNEYVDITVTIKDKDGNEVTGLDKLSDDQTYSLTVTVSPKTGTGAKSGTATAKINVFVPELTYQDSSINLGDTPNYASDNLVSEKWKHGNTYSTDSDITMTGTAPELDLSYDPEANAFTEDTPVSVTVKINGENVTDKVAFLHNTCDYDGCNFADVNCHFIVHIKTFDLTITKNITSDESSLYGERNFVFTITAEDGTKTQAVVNVEAGEKTGSTTIKGLPVGTYTITEDTVWSWRYDLKGVAAATDVKGTLEYTSGSASAKYTPSDGTHNEVVFTNSLTNYHWLSFVDSVRNFFNAK